MCDILCNFHKDYFKFEIIFEKLLSFQPSLTFPKFHFNYATAHRYNIYGFRIHLYNFKKRGRHEQYEEIRYGAPENVMPDCLGPQIGQKRS